MSEDFVDVYEATQRLGISRVTLYRLMDQRGIKRYKLPGNRRTHIRRDDLVVLEQPQEREPGGKAAA